VKIRDNNPSGPLGPLEPRRDTGPAKPASRPDEPVRTAASQLATPPGATRADLDDPARFEKLMRASVSQTIDASPLAAQLPSAQRAKLEAHLASDPAMRDLLGRWLEGTLR
jgi:hypothetical protein